MGLMWFLDLRVLILSGEGRGMTIFSASPVAIISVVMQGTTL